jgi:hypothetical protein
MAPDSPKVSTTDAPDLTSLRAPRRVLHAGLLLVVLLLLQLAGSILAVRVDAATNADCSIRSAETRPSTAGPEMVHSETAPVRVSPSAFARPTTEQCEACVGECLSYIRCGQCPAPKADPEVLRQILMVPKALARTDVMIRPAPESLVADPAEGVERIGERRSACSFSQ